MERELRERQHQLQRTEQPGDREHAAHSPPGEWVNDDDKEWCGW